MPRPDGEGSVVADVVFERFEKVGIEAEGRLIVADNPDSEVGGFVFYLDPEDPEKSVVQLARHASLTRRLTLLANQVRADGKDRWVWVKCTGIDPDNNQARAYEVRVWPYSRQRPARR